MKGLILIGCAFMGLWIHQILGGMALSWAAQSGNERAVRLLVALRVPVDYDDEGFNPLWRAASNGNTQVVRHLLANGAEVDLRNEFGDTPLNGCTFVRNNGDTVWLLLAHGADPNTIGSEGQTPLMGAASNGRSETIRILLDHGADPTIRDNEGKTAEAIAQKSGFPQTAQILRKAVEDWHRKHPNSAAHTP